MMEGSTIHRLITAAERLAEECGELTFTVPVTHVYHPLIYAWNPHKSYLRRYGGGRKRVVFLGMNPGPWGMAQTGVPFGEIRTVAEWLHIQDSVGLPRTPHPAKPVSGFRCTRSEVSGRRLWGLMRERWGAAEVFFREHFVANYCPLLFLEESGRNRTPDKLKKGERDELFRICDRHLLATIAVLKPEWVIGVGRFAEERIRAVLCGTPGGLGRHPELPTDVRVARVLHPSPANPQANRGWARIAAQELEALGVW